jgi:hypothetical protein
LLYFVKREQSVRAGLKSTKCVQNQERFMRRTLLAPPPHIQVSKLPEKAVGLGHRSD